MWHANIGRHSARNINLAQNSVWHAQLGGGVVQRNNMSAALLAQLGPASTVFAEGATGAEIPTDRDTALLFGVGASLRPSVPITTTANKSTLTVHAVVHVDNRGTAESDVACTASLANNPRQFEGLITVGTPPPTHGIPFWAGQITVLGRWAVTAGAHTVTLSCRPSAPPTGSVTVSAGAQMLLIAAP